MLSVSRPDICGVCWCSVVDVYAFCIINVDLLCTRISNLVVVLTISTRLADLKKSISSWQWWRTTLTNLHMHWNRDLHRWMHSRDCNRRETEALRHQWTCKHQQYYSTATHPPSALTWEILGRRLVWGLWFLWGVCRHRTACRLQWARTACPPAPPWSEHEGSLSPVSTPLVEQLLPSFSPPC